LAVNGLPLRTSASSTPTLAGTAGVDGLAVLERRPGLGTVGGVEAAGGEVAWAGVVGAFGEEASAMVPGIQTEESVTVCWRHWGVTQCSCFGNWKSAADGRGWQLLNVGGAQGLSDVIATCRCRLYCVCGDRLLLLRLPTEAANSWARIVHESRI
jgi:hypothetical protein